MHFHSAFVPVALLATIAKSSSEIPNDADFAFPDSIDPTSLNTLITSSDALDDQEALQGFFLMIS